MQKQFCNSQKTTRRKQKRNNAPKLLPSKLIRFHKRNQVTVTLKKYLSQFTKEQLIGQILKLHKKYKDVKEYYEFSINPDVTTKRGKVKEAVLECFYPKRGFKLRLKDAREIISGFKKLEPDAESLADVMLYYVECGVRFTNDFGDIDEPFYVSIERMFIDTANFIQDNGLNDIFLARANKIVEDSNGIGWGFHDAILNIYFNFFELEE
jgi:hypothetical protein